MTAVAVVSISPLVAVVGMSPCVVGGGGDVTVV